MNKATEHCHILKAGFVAPQVTASSLGSHVMTRLLSVDSKGFRMFLFSSFREYFLKPCSHFCLHLSIWVEVLELNLRISSLFPKCPGLSLLVSIAPTEHVGAAVTFVTCIWEVLGANSDQDTNNPDFSFPYPFRQTQRQCLEQDMTASLNVLPNSCSRINATRRRV